jgi:hypothetical protein
MKRRVGVMLCAKDAARSNSCAACSQHRRRKVNVCVCVCVCARVFVRERARELCVRERGEVKRDLEALESARRQTRNAECVYGG